MKDIAQEINHKYEARKVLFLGEKEEDRVCFAIDEIIKSKFYSSIDKSRFLTRLEGELLAKSTEDLGKDLDDKISFWLFYLRREKNKNLL